MTQMIVMRVRKFARMRCSVQTLNDLDKTPENRSGNKTNDNTGSYELSANFADTISESHHKYGREIGHVWLCSGRAENARILSSERFTSVSQTLWMMSQQVDSWHHGRGCTLAEASLSQAIAMLLYTTDPLDPFNTSQCQQTLGCLLWIPVV